MDLLLAARFMQGVAAGGTRVLVVAIIRDRFHGLGHGADHVAGDDRVHDRAGAGADASARRVLAARRAGGTSSSRSPPMAMMLALWGGLRMPETLAPADRRPLSPVASIAAAIGETLEQPRLDRQHASPRPWPSAACSPSSARSSRSSSTSSRAPELIGLVFACIAGPMALSSYANSRLVMRLGARRLLLTALTAFTVIGPASISRSSLAHGRDALGCSS